MIYLESHPECGLVHTHVKEYIQKNNKFKDGLSGYNIKDIDTYFIWNPIRTLSTCYRTNLGKAYSQEIGRYHLWKMSDFPVWIYILMNSKIHFIPDVTGVYRVTDESASHSNSLQHRISFIYSSLSARLFLAKYYNKEYLTNRIRVNNLGWLITEYKKHGEKPPFWKCLKKYKSAMFRLGFLKDFI